MTIQVAQVLNQVRLRLADGDKQKWKDERLVFLLNEALQQVALRTKLFITRGYVPVENGKIFYNLSDKILKLSRMAYKDAGDTDSVAIPLISHSEMDELGRVSSGSRDSRRIGYDSPYSDFGFHVGVGWDNDTGSEPLAVVVSNQQPGNFRLYPIPTFTVTPGTTVDLEGSDQAGILTGVEALAAEPLDTINSDQLMAFGSINTELPPRYLIIHYVEHPAEVANTESTQNGRMSTLDLNRQYSTPIENYIVFKALRDQIDTYDRERAEREYAFFLESLKYLEDERSSDFREAPTVDLSPNWNG